MTNEIYPKFSIVPDPMFRKRTLVIHDHINGDNLEYYLNSMGFGDDWYTFMWGQKSFEFSLIKEIDYLIVCGALYNSGSKWYFDKSKIISADTDIEVFDGVEDFQL